MGERKYFGTDGIRGRVGDGPITAEFMLKLGWAAGQVLGCGRRNSVVIGKDTRISGYMFESALEAGLSASGVDIRLLGPMPTPAIAYLTRTLHACAGIVISASHNPHYDNGIKFFSAQGAKLPDEVEQAIEDALDQPIVTVDSSRLGKAERVVDARGRYIEYCKSTVPASLNLSGLKIVVDCANGATYHVAPSVLDELGADVVAMGVDPDGLNINHECGSTEPARLQALVREQQADLGIALDGDGDRLIMVDHMGELVDGDELLFIIARSRHQAGQLRGAVVGTHIICLDRTTTGDGIISALQVLAEMMQSGRSLHELKQGMRKYPMHMINVPVSSRVDLGAATLVQEAVKAAETRMQGRGRVLLRPSGTEPVVRVMVEGEDDVLVREQVAVLAAVVASSC
ncbi:MAG: phosphoglucosamine mutase [Xanthomonadaceae bacterium]|nr:phosphoglucosamine mutase [Xanthomonadaceae bacterium]